MGDRDDESTPVQSQSPTAQVVSVSAIVALLGVLLVAPPLDEFEVAAGTVGLVLAEAIVLYVGYGALTRVASPAAREILASE